LSVLRSLVGVRFLVWFLPSREVVSFFYGVAGGRSPSGIAERNNDYLETSFLPGRSFGSPADFNAQLGG
jgi:hypothetical protein